MSILELLKPEILDSGDGSARLRFSVRDDFKIASGVVQGGITSAMLDMAMAVAAGGAISTVSLQVEIHRPVLAERLDVVAEVTRKGRRIVFCEADMFDADGVLLARGRQTAVP